MEASVKEERKPALLIVDDDPLITDTLHFVLSNDFEVFVAESRQQVKSLLTQLDTAPPLALVDLGLPPTQHKPDEGFALISDLINYSKQTRILVLSGQNDEANARHARALGAIDFIAKPAEPERIKQALLSALRFDQESQPAPVPETDSNRIVGASFAMDRLRSQIKLYADTPFPVLIEGESGSGKELVAKSLHLWSKRSGKPYLALNCAAISPTLVEPTLFGYAKGSFTGATQAHSGYFEDASEGTLFLDEIGELPLELQAKLLRVLQEGEIERLGGRAPTKVNVRIIAATNRDLASMVRRGLFREDLYYRLNVVPLKIPALRERRADILDLAKFFSEVSSHLNGRLVRAFSKAAEQRLLEWAWPGNVRELENVVERAVLYATGDSIEVQDLAFDENQPGILSNLETHAPNGQVQVSSVQAAGIAPGMTVSEAERLLIMKTLEYTSQNRTKAAKLLGISIRTLRNKLHEYGVMHG